MASAKTAMSSSSAAMKKRGAAVAFNEKEEGTNQSQESEKECVICLDQLSAKVVGSLDSCEHRFCFECIESWGTTRENTCPLCKARFKTITKHDPQDAKSGAGGSKGKGRKKRLQKITVQDRDQATSMEPPIPQHFLFPPFILFNPQNYMDFGPDFADDDDDEDDAAALATLENFLVDPLAAFARLAGGGGGGGQVMMPDNLFRAAAPAPPRNRVPPARSDPVTTLVEFSRRNTQNGAVRAAPAPRFGIGSGGVASSGSSSRTVPRSDGVGSSASNPVVLVNDCSDDDSDEVRIVSGPAWNGSAASRARRQQHRDRSDNTWELVFSSGASSSEANHATPGAAAGASSSMYTRGRRARGAQRQAQESGGAAAASSSSTTSVSASRAGSSRMATSGTPIANIPAPMPRRTPTVTFNDVVEVDGLPPARRAHRVRSARSRTGGRNPPTYMWAESDDEEEEEWEL